MTEKSGNPKFGSARYDGLLQEADVHVYRTLISGVELKAFCYGTELDCRGEHSRTAILFFHGGLFDRGHPAQFVPQCMHFVRRGCVAITFEYRLLGSGGGAGLQGQEEAGASEVISPMSAVEDAQTAILWVKKNARFFGVDPDRVVAVGGAAGGFLALSAALRMDGPSMDEFDCRPAAVGLLSGLYDTSFKRGVATDRFPDRPTAEAANPMKLVRKGLPPIFIAHGKRDRLIPFAQVERFVKAMRRKKNEVIMLDFEGAEHSFYNLNVDENRYEITIDALDSFLVQFGFAEPDVVI